MRDGEVGQGERRVLGAFGVAGQAASPRSASLRAARASGVLGKSAAFPSVTSAWFISTNVRVDRSYAANAAVWSGSVASAPASMYAPTSARLVPCPVRNDGACAASPTSATRPADQRGRWIWLTTSKKRSSAVRIAAVRRGISHRSPA
ncbi:hypothetical protein NDW01_21645 [Actinoallomurus sp. WRP6H-15]|nr:hypothetical protein [Actinoallomurus soli]MCO5971009.1 hypothetical protein [Actinoallomurus soli]